MRRVCCFLLCALLLGTAANAADWLDTGALDGALTAEERASVGGVTPEGGDASSGFRGLLQSAVRAFRAQLKDAVAAGFLSLALCALVSLAQGFGHSAGLSGTDRAAELTAVCGLLLICFSGSGTLVTQCEESIARLDVFSKTLTTAFAAAGAVAGKPVSAVATSAAAMLFSNVLIALSRAVMLPLVRILILIGAAGAAADSPLLLRGTKLLKDGATTFYKWVLMAFTGYISLSGLISGAADAAAVKTAQAAIVTAVPVVGNILAGTSEALLAGARALRAGIGLFGCLGAAAICLTPFVRALCHLLIYRLLAVFAASFAPAGAQKLLEQVSDAYGLALGSLGACCLAQFIAIIASLTVAGA